MPRTMIQRLAKGVLPPNTQIQKDAITAFTKAATLFVSYISHKYVPRFSLDLSYLILTSLILTSLTLTVLTVTYLTVTFINIPDRLSTPCSLYVLSFSYTSCPHLTSPRFIRFSITQSNPTAVLTPTPTNPNAKPSRPPTYFSACETPSSKRYYHA